MIFSELYSAYYNTVASIIKKAISSPITNTQITKIIQDNAFGESFWIIEKSLNDGTWPFIKSDGTSAINVVPKMPLTTLQKMWVNAIALDPRMKLFPNSIITFPEVEPLFTNEDFYIFDKYLDGDDYANEDYINNFRTILDSIKKGYALKFNVYDKKGNLVTFIAQPKYIEYSEKDDKFRLKTIGCRYYDIINISKIISCEKSDKIFPKVELSKKSKKCQLVLEVTDTRNTLERVLLHFAHLKKEAERIDNNHYIVKIEYDENDETEIVIRVLMFGPTVKVLEPTTFINLIKERLQKQKTLSNRK